LVELLDASVNGTLEKLKWKWKPAGERVRGDGQWRLSRQLCQRQANPWPGRKRRMLPNVKVFHRGHGEGRGANRHQRRPRPGRDGVGKGFEKARQAAAYAAVERFNSTARSSATTSRRKLCRSRGNETSNFPNHERHEIREGISFSQRLLTSSSYR